MNLKEILKSKFGYNSFRPLQREIIESVLAGNDTLAILPTSAGKSLTFQLPAMILPGLTIVISPLISLMKDQHDNLTNNGIPSAILNSTKTVKQKREIAERLKAEEIKILYLSAEGIQNIKLLSFLKRLNVSLIVHDECHVASIWSHDFRPAYGKLAHLKDIFPETPCIGLTATATQRVIEETINLLGMRNPKIFKESFDRPNLLIEVREKTDIYSDLLKLYGETYNNGANIIYCISRQETVDLSIKIGTFNKHRGKSDYYHGGRNKKDRERVQNEFMNGRITDLVATSAFGMGVNKLDVRVLIHASMPQSIPDLQQQIGRAGRDGRVSKCVVYYDPDDICRWEYIIDTTTAVTEKDTHEEAKIKLQHRENQYAMLRDVSDYCESSECRRKTLLAYFGEYHPGNCQRCNICLKGG